MTWLYVLIDVLILLLIVALILVVLYFWNKKKELNIGSLSEFRNNTIYEKSYETSYTFRLLPHLQPNRNLQPLPLQLPSVR